MIRTVRPSRAAVCVVALLVAAAATAAADWPVSGRPVSKLATVTSAMLTFLQDNGIESAILGISRNGTIIYLRGFGYLDGGVELQENTMWRLANVTKTLTAAATQRLIKDGTFGGGATAGRSETK